jgi:hypothetical protein
MFRIDLLNANVLLKLHSVSSLLKLKLYCVVLLFLILELKLYCVALFPYYC